MSNQSRGPCETCGHDAHLIDAMCATCRAKHKVGTVIIDRDRLLEVLSRHIGAEHGVTIKQLADECVGASVVMEANDAARQQRHLRELVVELRIEGHHICAHPSRGYYMAANGDELDETCQHLHSRAMTSLRQVSAMKRVSLPDLVGQLNLRT